MNVKIEKSLLLSYLVFWDLNADVEELTGRLWVGVVASGDLVLAGEARLGDGVRGVVGGSNHLTHRWPPEPTPAQEHGHQQAWKKYNAR